MLEAFRDASLRLGFSMLYMATHCACQRGLSHLICCPEPRVARLAQSIGFQQVAPRFHHEATGRDIVPMVLDLRQLELPSLTRAREPGLLEAFELVESLKGEEEIESPDLEPAVRIPETAPKR